MTSHVHAVLHDFSISDGAAPSGEMLQSSAGFYGVTSAGGAGNGTIYRLVP